MGFGCSYHPYECSHDKYCEHCTNAVTEGHDPKKCWLCCDGDPATNKPVQFVKEPFAVRIRVRDWSERKNELEQKMKEMVGKQMPLLINNENWWPERYVVESNRVAFNAGIEAALEALPEKEIQHPATHPDYNWGQEKTWNDCLDQARSNIERLKK